MSSTKVIGIDDLQSEDGDDVEEQQNLAIIIKCVQQIEVIWKITQARIYDFLPPSISEPLLDIIVGYLGHIDVESHDSLPDIS